MAKISIEIDGFTYDEETSLDLRNKIIEYRDKALLDGDFEKTITLSHVIAWMYRAIEKLKVTSNA